MYILQKIMIFFYLSFFTSVILNMYKYFFQMPAQNNTIILLYLLSFMLILVLFPAKPTRCILTIKSIIITAFTYTMFLCFGNISLIEVFFLCILVIYLLHISSIINIKNNLLIKILKNIIVFVFIILSIFGLYLPAKDIAIRTIEKYSHHEQQIEIMPYLKSAIYDKNNSYNEKFQIPKDVFNKLNLHKRFPDKRIDLLYLKELSQTRDINDPRIIYIDLHNIFVVKDEQYNIISYADEYMQIAVLEENSCWYLQEYIYPTSADWLH